MNRVRGGSRTLPANARWLAPAGTFLATIAVVAALGHHAPEPIPHVPFSLLLAMFLLAEVDGYLGADERRGSVPPVARIPLVIGLVLDHPMHLLAAQGLAMLIATALPDGRRRSEHAVDMAATLGATGLGILAFVAMSEPLPSSGVEVWLDAAVGGLVVVAAGHAADAVRREPRAGSLRADLAARAPTVGQDLAAIAGGLLVVEVLRADLAAGWLLALPTVAVLLTRRRLALSAARSAALVRLSEANTQLRSTTDVQQAAQVVATELAAMTRAADVRVTIRPPATLRRTMEASEVCATAAGTEALRSPFGRWPRASSRRDGDVGTVVQVPVPFGAELIGTLEVADRPGARRIARVHPCSVHLLAEALGQHLEQLDRLASARLNAASDRRMAERFRQLNDELERVTTARSTFLASISHELRAPLSALLVEGQVLEQLLADGSTDGVPPLVRGIGENTRHLLRMVDDLLAQARLECDRLDVVLLPLDLVEVVTTVAETFRPMLVGSGITLSLEAPSHARVLGDRDRVWQVIANLLDNAVRVLPVGGRVELRVRVQDDRTSVDVTDSGPGIAREELERLFAPFERGEVRGPGLGLGLAIARALMQRHGGDLMATSTPGVGSTFSAWFPPLAGHVREVGGPAPGAVAGMAPATTERLGTAALVPARTS